MKQWRYTGKVYDIDDLDYLFFPIGCDKGSAYLQDGTRFDVAILPDGTVAELEEAEWEWTEETTE